MKTTSSRKPGGQPGNSNAVKHGLFCRKNRLAASTDFHFYSECRETVEQIQDSLKNKRVCRQNPTADHARAHLLSLTIPHPRKTTAPE